VQRLAPRAFHFPPLFRRGRHPLQAANQIPAFLVDFVGTPARPDEDHEGLGEQVMDAFMRDLRSRLPAAGWALRLETRRPPGPNGIPTGAEWLVESLTPPIGRQVVLAFRILQFDPFYGQHLFEIAVRPPVWPSRPSPEAQLEPRQAETWSFRQLFRVMEWFRDPWSPLLWQEMYPGDWVPPEDWDAEKLPAAVDVDDSWESCADPEGMLRCLRPSLSERKLRLLACALCRLLPLTMLHDRNRFAVAVAELHAEGARPRRDLKKACKPSAVAWLLNVEPFRAVEESLQALVREGAADFAVRAAAVIRDVAGNPFHPVSLRRQWLQSNEAAVRSLAETIASDRSFDLLPILGDALEDAGCTDAVVLAHCRTAGEHVPGCWVVDGLLAKK
jgi:hypothetical protein